MSPPFVTEDELAEARWQSCQDRLKREFADKLRQAKREAIGRLGLPLKDLERIQAAGIRRTFATDSLHTNGGPVLVVLSGLPGRGKTTAASVWLHDWAADDRNWSWVNDWTPRLTGGGGMFIAAAEIGDAVRDRQDMKRKLCTVGRLVVDDLGVEFGDQGGWFSSLLDGLVNKRYASRLPTLVTTNLAAEEFKARYGERIARRIREAGRFVNVDGPDLSCTP